ITENTSERSTEAALDSLNKLLSNKNFSPELMPVLIILLQDLKGSKLVDKIEEIGEAVESNSPLIQHIKQIPHEQLTAAVNGCNEGEVESLFRQL
ncbi:MAG: hypothetical protein D6769_01005, partial [Methanobacteriota archaeon]